VHAQADAEQFKPRAVSAGSAHQAFATTPSHRRFPIAHVDDLNALSFLDYLREVAVRGKRQIFFATANDKLATLIERKFDFLGADFKKIALNRSF
jgi:hypothetical protein